MNVVIRSGKKALNSIKLHSVTLETLLSDSDDFVKEIEEDLSAEPKEEEFVYHTANGMLSYPGRELLADILKQSSKKDIEAKVEAKVEAKAESKTSKSESATSECVERTMIPELGYYLKFPIIDNLKNIPPSLYYFKGDDNNAAGVYINLLGNNIARIPFPEIIDSKREFNRSHSIRCKYIDYDNCKTQRAKMAKLYNSEIRSCNFAHRGDKMVKIGYPSRCSSIPDFGNPKTMALDIKKISIFDVKNILMYGLNDIITSIVWLDYNHMTGHTLDELEMA